MPFSLYPAPALEQAYLDLAGTLFWGVLVLVALIVGAGSLAVIGIVAFVQHGSR